MDKNENKLNLPTIRKTGEVLGKQTTKSISKFDLDKKTQVASIMKNETSSVAKDIVNSEKGLDLVLVGDLTTSMTKYHQLLKDKFKELCHKLFSMIDNLKIGIIFYLDHDAGLPYCTTVSKLSSNIEQLVYFIENTPVLHSGNSTDDEAVEDALYDAININWREIGSRSVVLFGDARPHEPSGCPKNYSYFDLTKRMYQSNIVVNSVFCGDKIRYSNEQLQYMKNVDIGDFSIRLSSPSDPEFFSWIANVTGGMIIGVERVDDLVDIIMAAAAKDSGHLDDLEEKLKTSAPNKLKLIEIAKKAEQRKHLGGDNRKLLR
ncbi:MAG: hypothetical protein LBU73_07565 [Helicobacteraceae bacterium]|jgi:hypothetical protein|nr:hypothetical protein [Helicobacteraceae bacterium]